MLKNTIKEVDGTTVRTGGANERQPNINLGFKNSNSQICLNPWIAATEFHWLNVNSVSAEDLNGS